MTQQLDVDYGLHKELFKREFLRALREKPLVAAKIYLETVLPEHERAVLASGGRYQVTDTIAKLEQAKKILDLKDTLSKVDLSIGFSVPGTEVGISIGTDGLEFLTVFTSMDEDEAVKTVVEHIQNNDAFYLSVAEDIHNVKNGVIAPFPQFKEQLWERYRGELSICKPEVGSVCDSAINIIAPTFGLELKEGVNKFEEFKAGIQKKLGVGDTTPLAKAAETVGELVGSVAYEFIPGPDGKPRLIGTQALEKFYEQLSEEEKARVEKNPEELSRLYNVRNPLPVQPEDVIKDIKETQYIAKTTFKAAIDVAMLFSDAPEIKLAAEVGSTMIDFAAGIAMLYAGGPFSIATLSSTVSSGVSLFKSLSGIKEGGGVGEAITQILKNQRVMLQSLQRIETKLEEIDSNLESFKTETRYQLREIVSIIKQLERNNEVRFDWINRRLDAIEAQIGDLSLTLREIAQNDDYTDVESMELFLKTTVDDRENIEKTLLEERASIREKFASLATLGYFKAAGEPYANNIPIEAYAIKSNSLLSASRNTNAVGQLRSVLSWLESHKTELGVKSPVPQLTSVLGTNADPIERNGLVNPVLWRRIVEKYIELGLQLPRNYLDHSSGLGELLKAGEEWKAAGTELRAAIPAAFEAYKNIAAQVAQAIMIKYPHQVATENEKREISIYNLFTQPVDWQVLRRNYINNLVFIEPWNDAFRLEYVFKAYGDPTPSEVYLSEVEEPYELQFDEQSQRFSEDTRLFRAVYYERLGVFKKLGWIDEGKESLLLYTPEAKQFDVALFRNNKPYPDHTRIQFYCGDFYRGRRLYLTEKFLNTAATVFGSNRGKTILSDGSTLVGSLIGNLERWRLEELNVSVAMEALRQPYEVGHLANRLVLALNDSNGKILVKNLTDTVVVDPENMESEVGTAPLSAHLVRLNFVDIDISVLKQDVLNWLEGEGQFPSFSSGIWQTIDANGEWNTDNTYIEYFFNRMWGEYERGKLRPFDPQFVDATTPEDDAMFYLLFRKTPFFDVEDPDRIWEDGRSVYTCLDEATDLLQKELDKTVQNIRNDLELDLINDEVLPAGLLDLLDEAQYVLTLLLDYAYPNTSEQLRAVLGYNVSTNFESFERQQTVSGTGFYISLNNEIITGEGTQGLSTASVPFGERLGHLNLSPLFDPSIDKSPSDKIYKLLKEGDLYNLLLTAIRLQTVGSFSWEDYVDGLSIDLDATPKVPTDILRGLKLIETSSRLFADMKVDHT